MSKKSSNSRKEKTQLHPRNKHRLGYDFDRLARSYPLLKKYLHINTYQNISIDFFDPQAVNALNTALLLTHYGIEFWQIPAGYLCPAVPGRADYVHHIANLIHHHRSGTSISKKPHIHCLDIGTGANCIYPIIGISDYDWTFVGTDIDQAALQSAKHIVSSNTALQGKVELRFQDRPTNIFSGILYDDDYFDLCICNPPFHESAKAASTTAKRKLKNLGQTSTSDYVLNFGGTNSELWCEGGELAFITQMIEESVLFSNSCFWFSTLISKHEHLDTLVRTLSLKNPTIIKTIPMGQGHKTSRILAWTYLSEKQQDIWTKTRWT